MIFQVKNLFFQNEETKTLYMANQPTPPNVTPPEIRPYDQGLLTIGFP